MSIGRNALCVTLSAQYEWGTHSFLMPIGRSSFCGTKLKQDGWTVLQVFKGEYIHAPVAIKVLKVNSARALKDALSEMKVLQKIHHPHIVRLMGYTISEEVRTDKDASIITLVDLSHCFLFMPVVLYYCAMQCTVEAFWLFRQASKIISSLLWLQLFYGQSPGNKTRDLRCMSQEMTVYM